MARKMCNRCGSNYRRTNGGNMKMTGGTVSLDSNLCPDCYSEMIAAYKDH